MASALRLVVDTYCGGDTSQTLCKGGRGEMKGDTGLELNWYIMPANRVCPQHTRMRLEIGLLDGAAVEGGAGGW
jgi:hypothetical protein